MQSTAPVGMGSNVLPGCTNNPEVRARPARPITEPGPTPISSPGPGQTPGSVPGQVGPIQNIVGLMPLIIPPKPDYSTYNHQQTIDARMDFVSKFNQLRTNYMPTLISPPVEASLDAIHNTYVDNVKLLLVGIKCKEWKQYIKYGLVLIEKGACWSVLDIEGFSKHHEQALRNFDPILAEFAHQYLFSETGVWAPQYRLLWNFAISLGLYWLARYTSKTFGASIDTIYPGFISQFDTITSNTVQTPSAQPAVPPALQGMNINGLISSVLGGGGLSGILNMFTGAQGQGQSQGQASPSRPPRPVYD